MTAVREETPECLSPTIKNVQALLQRDPHQAEEWEMTLDASHTLLERPALSQDSSFSKYIWCSCLSAAPGMSAAPLVVVPSAIPGGPTCCSSYWCLCCSCSSSCFSFQCRWRETTAYGWLVQNCEAGNTLCGNLSQHSATSLGTSRDSPAIQWPQRISRSIGWKSAMTVKQTSMWPLNVLMQKFNSAMWIGGQAVECTSL